MNEQLLAEIEKLGTDLSRVTKERDELKEKLSICNSVNFIANSQIDSLRSALLRVTEKQDRMKEFNAQRGEIKSFERQVKFVLLPAQRAGDVSVLQTGGDWVLTVARGRGRVTEREVAYYADFVVHHLDGEVVVVDVKSNMTRSLPAYKLKRKLMRWVYGIEIMEV